MAKTKCNNCNTEFVCNANSSEPCWCSALPNIVPLDSLSCLCPACLQKKIKELQTTKQTKGRFIKN